MVSGFRSSLMVIELIWSEHARVLAVFAICIRSFQTSRLWVLARCKLGLHFALLSQSHGSRGRSSGQVEEGDDFACEPAASHFGAMTPKPRLIIAPAQKVE